MIDVIANGIIGNVVIVIVIAIRRTTTVIEFTSSGYLITIIVVIIIIIINIATRLPLGSDEPLSDDHWFQLNPSSMRTAALNSSTPVDEIARKVRR